MKTETKNIETLELMAWHFEHIKAKQLKGVPEVHHQHFCSFTDESKDVENTTCHKD